MNKQLKNTFCFDRSKLQQREKEEQIKQKLLRPIYNGCNDNFYLLWKNKHDQYSEVCFWKKYNNNKI